MKVLVCGGRDYEDWKTGFLVLNAIHEKRRITHVIHGGANGADHLADLWARERRIPTTVFPANWNAHGKAAGPIRNKLMLLENPALVVAFPGGRGTAHMVGIAKQAGIEVMEGAYMKNNHYHKYIFQGTEECGDLKQKVYQCDCGDLRKECVMEEVS